MINILVNVFIRRFSNIKQVGPQKGGRYHQGYFVPKNPEKYVGNSKNIVFRSGLEMRFYKYFDTEDNIINWAVEEFNLPYYSPVDKKMHRYFVDAIFRLKTGERIVAEIKPFSQCKEPIKPKTNNRKAILRYNRELKTWAVNNAKWEAAVKFCEARDMQFMVLTEKNLPKILR